MNRDKDLEHSLMDKFLDFMTLMYQIYGEIVLEKKKKKVKEDD